MRDLIGTIRRRPWPFVLAYALWWGPFVLGAVFPVQHPAANLRAIQSMYRSAAVENWLSGHLPPVVAIAASNLLACVALFGIIHLAGQGEPGRRLHQGAARYRLLSRLGWWWAYPALAWLAFAAFYLLNGYLLLLGGQVLGHVLGLVLAVAALPHGFIELAAYALPTALLLFGPRLREDRPQVRDAAVMSAALVLVGAALEVYVTPAVLAVFLRR